jgi:hypothetical protein
MLQCSILADAATSRTIDTCGRREPPQRTKLRRRIDRGTE